MKVAVVGCGMIGSAAAKYLAKAGHDVTLFGPGEPAVKDATSDVFASHYDEGRITRRLDPHPVWSALAEASLDQYQKIERKSGISFYTQAGLLMAAPEGSAFLDNLRKTRAALNIPSRGRKGEALANAFPYLAFDPGTVAYHQPKDAGYISPRNLVAAQTKLAVKAGAERRADVVEAVIGNEVQTANGTCRFDAILVACGAWTNSVLPDGLALRPLARTIAFFELDAQEADRLAAMPPVIFRTPDDADPYALPPIRYPNGKTYLKIGGEPYDREMSGTAELKDWFASSGDRDLLPYMTERMEKLIPGLRFIASHTESCVVTYNETKLPYIGAVTDHIHVAAGGCGGAAKSSDALGHVAAGSVMGKRDDRFEIVCKKEHNA